MRALDALDAGHSVLVAAPTGAGKTLVAEYAVAKARAEGGKVFYTTPLKALSNQKFGDFRRALGDDLVGLLTGDNSINGEAPVVVMTTEVLRNMIYAESPTLAGLHYVVLDEVHYLQDPARGAVWEEVIVHLPETVTLVALSATVSNAEEVGDWLRTVRGETAVVVEERRPVQLRHLYMVGNRDSGDVHLLPTFVGDEFRPNPEAARLASDGGRGGGPSRGGRRRSRLFTPTRLDVLEALQADGLLPAINFIFSRAACDQAVEQCVRTGVRLTTDEERDAIVEIAERRVGVLSDDELTVLGYGAWLDALQRGIAAHHAGVVPPMKEGVEEAFAAGLVKLVFATETLALGVNMPARTVVIERLTKFTGEHHEFLTPGEYTQLTGRAGRRGIDTVGYAVALWSPFVSYEQTAALGVDAQLRAHVELPAHVPHGREPGAPPRRRGGAPPPEPLVRPVPRRSGGGGADAPPGADPQRGHPGPARGRLRPGRRGGLPPSPLRLEPGAARAGWRAGGRPRRARPPAPGRHRDRRRRALGRAPAGGPSQPRPPGLGADGQGPAHAAGRGRLRPGPGGRRPHRAAAAVRPATTTAGRSGRSTWPAGPSSTACPVRGGPGSRRPSGSARRSPPTRSGAAPTTAATWPRPSAWNGWSATSTGSPTGSSAGATTWPGTSIACCALLESWHYVDVDRWTLTPAGELLSGLGAESDLLIAEALRTGLFDGLQPASLAALASCFTYEFRGPDDEKARRRIAWPDQELVNRWAALERLGRDLAFAERDLGITPTRQPDPGFVEYAHPWASGEPLEHVLDEDSMAAGDFVRNVKQLLDVLRQIGEHAPLRETAIASRRAADALFRGVVAASSVVGS